MNLSTTELSLITGLGTNRISYLIRTKRDFPANVGGIWQSYDCQKFLDWCDKNAIPYNESVLEAIRDERIFYMQAREVLEALGRSYDNKCDVNYLYAAIQAGNFPAASKMSLGKRQLWSRAEITLFLSDRIPEITDNHFSREVVLAALNQVTKRQITPNLLSQWVRNGSFPAPRIESRVGPRRSGQRGRPVANRQHWHSDDLRNHSLGGRVLEWLTSDREWAQAG
jgi:predicted DNA-binding transcriptional regulator AlpA